MSTISGTTIQKAADDANAAACAIFGALRELRKVRAEGTDVILATLEKAGAHADSASAALGGVQCCGSFEQWQD